jgi:hypothetical protein
LYTGFICRSAIAVSLESLFAKALAEKMPTGASPVFCSLFLKIAKI